MPCIYVYVYVVAFVYLYLYVIPKAVGFEWKQGIWLHFSIDTSRSHLHLHLYLHTFVNPNLKLNIYTILYSQSERKDSYYIFLKQKERGEKDEGGGGRVPFNETYAPSLSTIYDGAQGSLNFLKMGLDPSPPPLLEAVSQPSQQEGVLRARGHSVLYERVGG